MSWNVSEKDISNNLTDMWKTHPLTPESHSEINKYQNNTITPMLGVHMVDTWVEEEYIHVFDYPETVYLKNYQVE